MIVGEAMSYLGDYTKATLSAAKIFKLIYDEPPIDAYSDAGLKEVGVFYRLQCHASLGFIGFRLIGLYYDAFRLLRSVTCKFY